MDQKKTDYQAYLLRLWCTEREGVRVWRASLEPPGTEVRLGFPNLDALFAYLREQTEQAGILSIEEPKIDQGGDDIKF